MINADGSNDNLIHAESLEDYSILPLSLVDTNVVAATSNIDGLLQSQPNEDYNKILLNENVKFLTPNNEERVGNVFDFIEGLIEKL